MALVASGGLSHWPGHYRHGDIDTEWDDQVLKILGSGETQKLGQYSDADIAVGGTGAAELRNWITLVGATGPAKVEILAYEPVTAFATGCAVTSVQC